MNIGSAGLELPARNRRKATLNIRKKSATSDVIRYVDIMSVITTFIQCHKVNIKHANVSTLLTKQGTMYREKSHQSQGTFNKTHWNCVEMNTDKQINIIAPCRVALLLTRVELSFLVCYLVSWYYQNPENKILTYQFLNRKDRMFVGFWVFQQKETSWPQNSFTIKLSKVFVITNKEEVPHCSIEI